MNLQASQSRICAQILIHQPMLIIDRTIEVAMLIQGALDGAFMEAVKSPLVDLTPPTAAHMTD
jgi:hypothetical protein